MVQLTVKGTKFPDEFIIERSLDFDVASGGATICHIQNTRHQLRLMLLSVQELSSESIPSNKKKGSDEEYTALVAAYSKLAEDLTERLKDKKTPVTDAEYDEYITELRAQTVVLLPDYCTHKDGTDAAIQELWAKHENPDLDEDERLTVYHCRAILDPSWKANELAKEEDAALWFCGKSMEGTLAAYCGRNEKSRLTVKVAPRGGPAPSGEPRMRYEDQRELFRHIREKRDALKSLEESELRDRVVRQSRGHVALPPSAASPQADLSAVRTICPQKEERVVPTTD